MTTREQIAGNEKALAHAKATLAEIEKTNKRIPGFYPETDVNQARKVVALYEKRLARQYASL